MMENSKQEVLPDEQPLDAAQKRRLRAVRRGYRAADVEIKDNGWQLEVQYLDGSKVSVNTKLLKIKAAELQE